MSDYLILGSVALLTILIAIIIGGASKRLIIFYDWTDFWLNILAVFGSFALAGLSNAFSEPLRTVTLYGSVAFYVVLSGYNFYASLRHNSFLPVIFNLPIALLKQFMTVLIAFFSILQLSRVFGETTPVRTKA